MKSVVFLFVFLSSSFLHGSVDTESFDATYYGFKNDEIHLSKTRLKDIHKYQYVFVGGFGNELAVGYFKDNIKFLKASGIPRNQITAVYPGTLDAVEANIPWLTMTLENLYAQKNKKIVLIAHSKGAAESLATVLSTPTLIHKMHQAYLVQGAIKGSYVADFFMDPHHKLDGRVRGLRKWEIITKLFLFDRIGNFIKGSVASLTHDAMAALWEKLKPGVDPIQQGYIQEKVVFVTTEDLPNRMSRAIGGSALYMTTHYGKSDGLLKVEDQFLEGYGGIIYMSDPLDHLDLLLSYPLANGPKVNRYAFMSSILKNL